jgi:hypothetical protein
MFSSKVHEIIKKALCGVETSQRGFDRKLALWYNVVGWYLFQSHPLRMERSTTHEKPFAGPSSVVCPFAGGLDPL